MAEFKVDEGKLKEVCSILKAILTSFGGELPMEQIDAEFRTVVGSSIPYKELKHATLASFLQSVPDVLKLKRKEGRLVAVVESDEDIDLILNQVKGQDNSKRNKMVKRKGHAELATRHLHGSRASQQYHNKRFQNYSNLQNTPWRLPNIQSRAKYTTSYQANPQQVQHRPLIVHPPPGIQTNTGTHRVAPPLLPISIATKPNPSVHAEVLDIKTKVSKQIPAKKTYKQQLIDAVEQIEDVEGKRGKIQLIFNTIPCGKKMEWVSVIKMGDLRVSSYPAQSSSQEEAEELASKKALDKLPVLTTKKQFPTTSDYDVSISRVKKLLKEKSCNKRFWWEPMQDLYTEVYRERLPYDWLMTVKDRSNLGLVFDNPCVDKWTVALRDESQIASTQEPQKTAAPKVPQETPSSPSPSTHNGKATDRSSLPAEQKPQLPPLNLPNTPTWDVFITCVEDTNTLQLLLVGEEYTGTYSELLTEMELYYMEKKNQHPVKEAAVGEVFVACHEESWFRVEVVESQGDTVEVKFVDHGDMESIPLSNLYHLEEKFFSLPPQALRCCLAGLEDAPQEAAFQSLMENLPMGKTLVARVQRREEPYALVIFDTSTSEDVNLNEKVLESIVQHLVEPSLPPVGGLAEVYLTYASTKGILHVRVESKTYKILDDLLKIATRRTEEMLGEKVQVDLTKLYLARFSKDGEWYRAAPRSDVDSNGKVLMRYVDYGNCEKVALSNIRGLQKLSPLLAKVPHQALPCRLHNVPADPELKWTLEACKRLMELASEESPLLLKVVSERTSSKPASVQLFKRLLPQNELVSINDTLGIDTKLFGSEGDSNNNSVEKEVVLSQVKSQQSSCVTGAALPSLPLEPPHQVGPDSFPPCSPLSLSDIPDISFYFDVFVTFAANPKNFAVQPWKMGKEFDHLSGNIQNYYNNPTNHKHVVGIESGQYCALKHSDDVWYRAKVEVVKDATVAGVFVDFGDRFFSTLENVQPLTPAFCTLPCLAIKAELHGIEAANKDWSPEDACRFRELAGNKNLVSVIYNKEVTSDGSLFLSLLLIDTSDKIRDVYINNVLVEEERAVYEEMEEL